MYEPVEVAKLISKTAKEKGISIKAMLEICGLGKNALSNMRDGKSIAYDSLLKMADYLEVTVSYLVGKETKTAQVEQSLSSEQQELLTSTDDLNKENLLKVLEYSELLRKSQNS